MTNSAIKKRLLPSLPGTDPGVGGWRSQSAEVKAFGRAADVVPGTALAGGRYWTDWVVAAALYVAASYPYQVTVFPWFGPSPHVAYAALCIIGILAALSHRQRRTTFRSRWPLLVPLCLLTCTMLVTLILCRNPIVARELLLLGLLASLVLSADDAATVRIIRALIYISALVLVPAILAVAMFNAHLIDWPTWGVERLGLIPGNPLLIRAQAADAVYYMPLWVAVVPFNPAVDQGFGLEFVRQPLVYIEATGTWLYTAGLLWLAVADSKMPARAVCVVILALALAVSFSVAGILATAAGLLLCLAIATGGRVLTWIVVAGGIILPALIPIPHLLSLVGSNKAEEFEFYTTSVDVLNSLTVFGNSPTPGDQPQSYGILMVLQRYGVVGFVVLCSCIVIMLGACFRLLRDSSTLGWRRFPFFVGTFVSVALLIKCPGIIPSMPVLCLLAGLTLRRTRMAPFSCTLAR